MGSTLEIASLGPPSRPQAANAPQCRPGTTRWRNIAARLMLVSIAGCLRRALPASADDEIRIGNTMPYTGPASAYGVIGKTIAAYFDKVNAEGGINGRKINSSPMTTATIPQKTVELTRSWWRRTGFFWSSPVSAAPPARRSGLI